MANSPQNIPPEYSTRNVEHPGPTLAALCRALGAITGLPDDDGMVLTMAAYLKARYGEMPQFLDNRWLPMAASVLESGFGEVAAVIYQGRIDRVRFENVVKSE